MLTVRGVRAWLSHLSMWHLGMVDVMFAEAATKDIVWDPATSTYIGSKEYYSDDEDDPDWNPLHDGETSASSDDSDDCSDTNAGYDSDDLAWCANAGTINTWEHKTVLRTKVSRRRKFQQRPLVLKSCN